MQTRPASGLSPQLNSHQHRYAVKSPAHPRRRQRQAPALGHRSHRLPADWFLRTKERPACEPFAIVNADVPQEIFRAMDLPYVVNQWWAAVCSAKQLSPTTWG